MTAYNYTRLKKAIFYLLLLILTGVLLFLLIPSNYYMRRAILHLKPKIDQYGIFENRVVKADNPHPWQFAADYDNKQIAPAFEADFKK